MMAARLIIMDRPPFDQRSRERLDVAILCPKCRSADVSVASRTPYVVYFRCTQCGEIWSVAKPGIAGAE